MRCVHVCTRTPVQCALFHCSLCKKSKEIILGLSSGLQVLSKCSHERDMPAEQLDKKFPLPRCHLFSFLLNFFWQPTYHFTRPDKLQFAYI